MNPVTRVIDNLINGNISDVREIFKALPSQEAAHLAVLVVTHLVCDHGERIGEGAILTLTRLLSTE